MRVFEKMGYPIKASLEEGAYALTILFEGTPGAGQR